MFKKVYNLYSAFCTQPAFYSQSASAFYTQSAFYPGPQSAFYTDRFKNARFFARLQTLSLGQIK